MSSYLKLYASGALKERIAQSHVRLEKCDICPRRCGVNRIKGEKGFCRAGADPVVASWNTHTWEEPPISGAKGSGTIFFSFCTGKCLFCQNYPISQLNVGQVFTLSRLAGVMVELQKRGCHNINFVTPTHFVPQILAALPEAIEQGLSIPLVYNSSGFESVETLRLLEDVIDIYLPDAKYDNDEIARELSGFPEYVENNRAALREIYRQVGDELILDAAGIAQRGMIIRHMILPENLAGTAGVLHWIARELSPRVHISVMSQYFPAHKAVGHPILSRKITLEEYDVALEAFESAGLENGWQQELEER